MSFPPVLTEAEAEQFLQVVQLRMKVRIHFIYHPSARWCDGRGRYNLPCLWRWGISPSRIKGGVTVAQIAELDGWSKFESICKRGSFTGARKIERKGLGRLET